jgi:hypothetical protein
VFVRARHRRECPFPVAVSPHQPTELVPLQLTVPMRRFSSRSRSPAVAARTPLRIPPTICAERTQAVPKGTAPPAVATTAWSTPTTSTPTTKSPTSGDRRPRDEPDGSSSRFRRDTRAMAATCLWDGVPAHTVELNLLVDQFGTKRAVVRAAYSPSAPEGASAAFTAGFVPGYALLARTVSESLVCSSARRQSTYARA